MPVDVDERDGARYLWPVCEKCPRLIYPRQRCLPTSDKKMTCWNEFFGDLTACLGGLN